MKLRFFHVEDLCRFMDVILKKSLSSIFLMWETRSLEDGLREAYAWYVKNAEEVARKPYIDVHLQDLHKG